LAAHHMLVLRADQAVVKYTQCLVTPQAQELLSVGKLVGCGQQQPLIHCKAGKDGGTWAN